MGTISVRLSRDEDKILKQLSEYFHADKSTLIKKSLLELYENMKDVEMIEVFEKKEKGKKVSFVTATEILND